MKRFNVGPFSKKVFVRRHTSMSQLKLLKEKEFPGVSFKKVLVLNNQHPRCLRKNNCQ